MLLTQDGVSYTIAAPGLQRYPIPDFPEVLRTTSEQRRSDRSGLSRHTFSFGGGFGLAKIDLSKPKHLDRFWASECETRWAGQVTPPLLVNTATGPEEETAADTVSIRAFAEFKGLYYGLALYTDTGTPSTYDVGVWVFDPDHASTQWDKKQDITTAQASIQTIGDLKTHGIYLFAAFSNTDAAGLGSIHATYRTTDGTTWTQKVIGLPAWATSDQTNQLLSFGTTLYLTLWDDSAGTILVYKSTDNGDNWSSVASVASSSPATSLASFVDIDGNDVPTLGTREGWYIIGASSIDGPWLDLRYSTSAYNCKGMTFFNGAFYVPVQAGMRKCNFTSNYLQVASMGLDRDDGLPAEDQGETVAMTPGSRWLFAAYGGLAANKKAGVYAYDDMTDSWHRIFKHGTANQVINCIGVSAQDDNLARLHISVETATNTSTLYYLDYVLDNPKSNTSIKYGTGKTIATPHFGGDEPEMNGAVFRLDLDADNLTASLETIGVKYGINGAAASTTTLGTFSSSDYDLAFGSNGIGITCKNIAFEFTPNRDTDTNTNKPIMYKPVLYYRKKPTTRYRYIYQIDVGASATSQSITVTALVSNLEGDKNSQTLIAIQWDTGVGNKYVDILSLDFKYEVMEGTIRSVSYATIVAEDALP